MPKKAQKVLTFDKNDAIIGVGNKERKDFTEMKATNKWVACWGYDQTQYSVYEEVSRKGCFVVVRGYNSWACLHESDLYNGSKVKLFEPIPYFHDIPAFERETIAKKHNWDLACVNSFDEWENFRRYEQRQRKDNADVRTIQKVTHEKDDKGYKYWVWQLDNGEIVKQTDIGHTWYVEIVDALTRRKIRTTNYFGEPEESIKIDECIRAYLDKDYDANAQKYAEQNEYTFYNGR